MITVYGIKNCDTCRKARKWLDAEGIAHEYHDFRADGLDKKTLSGWVATLGWETLLNRRGTTWRKLPESERDGLTPDSATALMLEHPTLIKRPVFDTGSDTLVGFSSTEQTALKQAGSGSLTLRSSYSAGPATGAGSASTPDVSVRFECEAAGINMPHRMMSAASAIRKP